MDSQCAIRAERDFVCGNYLCVLLEGVWTLSLLYFTEAASPVTHWRPLLVTGLVERTPASQWTNCLKWCFCCRS